MIGSVAAYPSLPARPRLQNAESPAGHTCPLFSGDPGSSAFPGSRVGPRGVARAPRKSAIAISDLNAGPLDLFGDTTDFPAKNPGFHPLVRRLPVKARTNDLEAMRELHESDLERGSHLRILRALV